MADIGDPINRPPLFDSRHFSWWKKRIRVYIESVDPQLWSIVENGPIKITTLDKNGAELEKPKSDWNENDHKKHSRNAKALNMLHCALTKEDFLFVSSYETAKEVWDALHAIFDGTSRIQRWRLIYLKERFYTFRMKEHESIKEMLCRFLSIVDELASHGYEVSMESQVSMILRGLLPKYKDFAILIREQVGEKNVPLNELFARLLFLEEEERGKAGIASYLIT